MITNTRPRFFKEVLHHTPVRTMVDNNWWSRLKYYEYDFDDGELRVNSTGNDFTEASIKKAMKSNGVNNTIIRHLQKSDPDKSILVFTDSVEAAIDMSEKVPYSACVNTKTRDSERDDIVRSFKGGEIKKLFNYNVFGVGFNYPNLDGIMLGRPTNSLMWYMQALGRVVRKANPEKMKIIADYCNNVKRFGPVENIDIRKVKMKKGYKYEMFREDVLLSGIYLDEIGSRLLKGEKIVKVKSGRQWSDSGTNVMTWGKHKGKPLARLPNNYLKWCIEQHWCQQYIRDEVERRKGIGKWK